MEHATQATVGVGTYGYMAPEVYNNQPYDKTVDIYSLGLVMYWLLNERRLPFLPLPPKAPKREDIELARIRRFSGRAIPAPKNGSAALKAVVLKACAFDPKQRYQSAAEMLKELNAIENGKTAVMPKPIIEEACVSTPDPEHEPETDNDATMGPVFVTPQAAPMAQEEADAADDAPTIGPLFITHKSEPAAKVADEDATSCVVRFNAQENISELDADATIGPAWITNNTKAARNVNEAAEK